MSVKRLDKWREENERKDRELQRQVLLGSLRTERNAQRRAQTLGRRLDRALLSASLLSSAPASGSGEGRRTKPGSRKPPSAASAALMHGEHDLASEYRRRLTLMVQRLEDEVDNYSIRKLGGGDETYEERIARLIKDYEGLSDAEVAFIDLSQGSVKTIRYERRKHGYDSLGRKVSDVA